MKRRSWLRRLLSRDQLTQFIPSDPQFAKLRERHGFRASESAGESLLNSRLVQTTGFVRHPRQERRAASAALPGEHHAQRLSPRADRDHRRRQRVDRWLGARRRAITARSSSVIRRRRVAALRNRGARAALGSIIAFADSDHEIDRNWIATAVEVLSEPSVAATGCALPDATRAPNWVQRQYDGLRSRPVRREEVTWLGSGNFAVKRCRVRARRRLQCRADRVRRRRPLQPSAARRLSHRRRSRLCAACTSAIRRRCKALFFGELWRGRDNLRVTFSGPRTFRHLRSALVPIADLACIAGGGAAHAAGHPVVALVSWALAAGAGRRSGPRSSCAGSLRRGVDGRRAGAGRRRGVRSRPRPGAAGTRQPSRAADGVTHDASAASGSRPRAAQRARHRRRPGEDHPARRRDGRPGARAGDGLLPARSARRASSAIDRAGRRRRRRLRRSRRAALVRSGGLAAAAAADRRAADRLVHAHDYKTNLLALLLSQPTGVAALSTVHGWTGHSTARAPAATTRPTSACWRGSRG